jgi:hypothetical protein
LAVDPTIDGLHVLDLASHEQRRLAAGALDA